MRAGRGAANGTPGSAAQAYASTRIGRITKGRFERKKRRWSVNTVWLCSQRVTLVSFVKSSWPAKKTWFGKSWITFRLTNWKWKDLRRSFNLAAKVNHNADRAIPPIVFVHGLFGHLRESAKAMEARGRVALAPDLLGYGERRKMSDVAVSLPAQVHELRSCIRSTFGNLRVDLVGHSVGGAIAMLLASEEPEMIRRVVSIEGNFTLKDAFWSASLGQMSIPQVAAVLEGFAADPAGWLARSGVPATAANLEIARDWVRFQPAITLRDMGHSTVEVTGSPAYLEAVRDVFDSSEVYLLSGERSHSQWDVPDWALTKAKKATTIKGTGHFLMLEQPTCFLETLDDILS